MTRLADAIEAEPVRKYSCKIAVLAESLDPDEAAELRAAVLDATVSQQRLARAISKAYGVAIGSTVIGNHRRGDCSSCRS